MNSTNHKTHGLLKVLELPPPQTCLLVKYTGWGGVNYTWNWKPQTLNLTIPVTTYLTAINVIPLILSYIVTYQLTSPLCIMLHCRTQWTWLLLVHRLAHNTSKHSVTDSFMLAWRFKLWLLGDITTKTKQTHSAQTNHIMLPANGVEVTFQHSQQHLQKVFNARGTCNQM